MRTNIFISHRTTDADIADMIKDFLVTTGIPNDKIFCSSLPGNDVNEKISPEVKQKLKEAEIIIIILSHEYYQSAYCLNEAGIAWYLDDVVTIAIGLPEIDQQKMAGFLNSDYKLRRLDNPDDISYIYDIAHEKLHSNDTKVSVVTRETQKLIKRYTDFVAERTINKNTYEEDKHSVHITTDAVLLLMYASVDSAGQIIYSRLDGGSVIATDGFNFIGDNTPKEIARWKGAFEELETNGLIKAANNKREIFDVTKEGFDLAEKLKENNPQIDTKVNPKEFLKENENISSRGIIM